MSFIPHASLTTSGLEITQLTKNATLLIPAVASGNVPQLSVDLLLSSLNSTLLGTFHSACVLPCIGYDAIETQQKQQKRKQQQQKGEKLIAKKPQSTDETKKSLPSPAYSPLVTAVQVFLIPVLNLVVFQQRAPVIVGRAAAFVEELLTFARTLPIARLILLTSSPAFRQNDEDLDSTHPVSYYIVEANKSAAAASTAAAPAASTSSIPAAVAPSGTTSLESLLRNTLNWNSLHFNRLQQDDAPLDLEQLNGAEETGDSLQMPSRRAGPTSSESKSNAPAADDDEAPIKIAPIVVPGLGITRPLFEAVTVAASSATPLTFPTVFLHCYINEGANDRDAMMITHQVYTFLDLIQVQESIQDSNSLFPDQKRAPPNQMAWRVPQSWSAMFGNEPEESLYL